MDISSTNLLKSLNKPTLQINATDRRHFNFKGPEKTESKFESILFKTLQNVNTDLKKPQELGLQAQLDPQSVNPHDVSIAILKANMSISITKQVAEKSIQAYKNIMNIR